MKIDLYIHIVERPDNPNYSSKFKQIYGFTEHDCDGSINSFTQKDFRVVYTKHVKVQDGNAVNEVARQVNDILEFSNRKEILDLKSLDELLR